MSGQPDRRYTVADLVYLMERLRCPDSGCPWDIQQTFDSIAPHTLEEAYEVVDCIERGDLAHLREELGDLLFQVVYHSRMAREQALFEFDDVVNDLVAKLVARHPHVFPEGDLAASFPAGSSGARRVRENWEEAKARERAEKASSDRSALADVPAGLAALSRAQKLQKRASRVGFDWSEARGVLDKIEEEAAELREALDRGDHNAVAYELGDLIFTCVNLARHLDVDAETATRKAAQKFERRFRAMETMLAEAGLRIADQDEKALEDWWQKGKQHAGQ
ncbi:nucleoside triphosphate pyrophosphohydrolase [Geoalkalibacter halelectricus]|uniref:nucleoside triphosphate pyrophosphohydrolase n=1 Tax=Geoalkalibacter halelectricus TaxID=2847045 RepID=UPI003D19312E